MNERGTSSLQLLKENFKTEGESLCDENILTAVEELSYLFSNFCGNLPPQLCKLFETSLKTIFHSSASQRLDDIFGRPDKFVVLECFISCGPPLVLLEVLLDSLKQQKVSISMFSKCIKRTVSKAGLEHLIDSMCASQEWTAHDISLLVSLPDRIFNCIQKEDIAFDSDEYYRNLFSAILNLQNRHSPQRIDSGTTSTDSLFSTLVSRFCAINRFRQFLCSCISFFRGNDISCQTQLTQWLVDVSPAYMEKMLSDLMAVMESDQESLSLMELCLVDVSKRNSFARKCLLLFVSRKQLIGISGVSVLCKIFWDVCDKSERQSILDEFLSLWSSYQLVTSQSIPYQFQITRLLLCFLKEMELDYLRSPKVLQAITNGIQCRLGNTEADVRYMGWVIGKQLGSLFGVDDSVLKETEDFQPSEDLENFNCLQLDLGDTHKVKAESCISEDLSTCLNTNVSNKASESKQDEIEAKFSELNVNDEANAENSEYLERYDISDDEECEVESDDEDGHLSKDKEEMVPSSIMELLNLFRKFRKQEDEESWDLSLFIKGLQQLQSMLNRRSQAVKGSLSELVIAVFLLDPSAVSPCKESNKLAELRYSTLLLLAEFSPRSFFITLISKVYQSDNTHLKDKCNVLTLLVNASQRLSGYSSLFSEENDTRKLAIEWKGDDTVSEERYGGTVLKMLHFSLRNMKLQGSRVINNRFAPVSVEAFFLIWNEVTKLSLRKSFFPEIHQVLLAQSISALSVFIFCAGNSCPSYGEMLLALIQIAFNYLRQSNYNLRRSALLALVVSLQIATSREAKQMEQQYRNTFYCSLVDYWMETFRQDPDDFCRELAFRCLELWCQKVPEEEYILSF